MMTTSAVDRSSSAAATTVLMRPRVRLACAEPMPRMPDWSSLEYWPDLQDAQGATLMRVQAAAGHQALYLHFRCPVSDHRLLIPRNAASASDYDRIALDLHPQNDPVRRWHVECDYRGQGSAALQLRVTGECSLEAVPDIWQTGGGKSIDNAEWTRFYGVEADHWWCQIALPWKALGLEERPATVGLSYSRLYRPSVDQPHVSYVSWPNGERASNCPTLLEPGEALVGPWAGAPQKLELANLQFGDNRARLTLPGDWPMRPAVARLQVLRPEGGACDEACRVPVQAGHNVDLPFSLDRAHSSHVDPFGTLQLDLTIVDQDSGQSIYHALLPVDRHTGLCVDEPYGSGNAVATDGDLRQAWMRRVVGQLPRLHRATTRQGAPSDFCLMHADGSVAVNLMGDDPWSDLAAIVEQRFQSAEDRLVAAMALVGQKSVTNLILSPMFFDVGWKLAYHTPHLENMGPLSIIRFGGGPPAERAVVLAEFLRRLANPITGKPFVARTVMLDANGGPRQLPYNRTPGKVLSYISQPGSVGAAAVELRGRWTLLDPTALAFFPSSADRLASLEQIVSDADLRQRGTGRLADFYAKLDIEETLRQPTDRPFAKGVFPELCPDEFGPDRPFDPRERQVIADRALVAPPGGSAHIVGFVDIFGRPSVRQGSLTVAPTADELVVTVDCTLDLAGCNTRDRAAECVTLALDVGHHHLEILAMSAWLEGDRRCFQAESNQIQTLFKHGTSHAYTEKRVLKDATWMATFSDADSGYRVMFRVPWKTLGLDGHNLPPTIGLNAWIDGRHPHYEQAFAAPPRWMRPGDAFSFMDLYLSPTPLVVRQIDLDVPKWGMNLARVTVANTGSVAASAELQFDNELGMAPTRRSLEPVSVSLPAGAQVEVLVPFFVDPTERMSGPQQLIALTVSDRQKSVYRGGWRIGYCGPLSAYQRYGSQLAHRPAGLPDYQDPIIDRKVQAICSRLPVFRRLTTRDGAASDFVVRSEDGRVEFNLMDDGVLDQIARWIESLFDNDLDRVLGMLFFNHAPWIARHMSTGHRYMEGAGPLSVVRGNFAGGGGNCGYHSRCFAGMISHLRLDGQRLVAHTLGVWGHSIAAIAWRGSKVLFDPDVGHFFLNAAGDDLATLEEMRRTDGIHTSAGGGELARFRTTTDGAVLLLRSIENLRFVGVFPPGGSPQ